jgi:lysophospholipase L1-like esterase
VDAAREGVLIRALKVDFDELVLFEDRNLRLVEIGCNDQFLAHKSPPWCGRDEQREELREMIDERRCAS